MSAGKAIVLRESRVPVLIFVILIYLSVLTSHDSDGKTPFETLLFSGLILIHAIMHSYAGVIFLTRPWGYFMLQGLIIFGSALLMPGSYSGLFLGLSTVLVGQSIGVYTERLKPITVGIYCCVLYALAVVWVGKAEDFLTTLPSLILLMVIVLGYAHLFFKQVREKTQTRLFLNELEWAHQKVEQLTIANERQRMARDLHDTLAQGVAGIMMQLDAADLQLNKGNVSRAQEIIQMSKGQAKRTLSEARGAIDDLRKHSSKVMDLEEAVLDETDRFSHSTGTQVQTQISIRQQFPKLVEEHTLHIIRECLANTAKYAKATNINIVLTDSENELYLRIEDDGVGFDTKLIGKQLGKYGLIGLHERARIMGGQINIESGKTGTHVSLHIPLQQEE